MKNVKIGIVGCGNWGKKILKNLLELNVLYKVFDQNLELLSQIPIPNEFKSKNINNLIDDPEIHGVIISTPPKTHKDIAIKSIENDKHVFIEKPFCLSISEADQIIKTAKKYKKIIFVGHLLHYHNGFIKLKEIINKNKIGRISIIKANRLNFGLIRQDESVIYDLASHDISMILSITKSMPKKVSVNSLFINSKQFPDLVNIVLSFDNNVFAIINSDWMSPYKEHRFSVYGKKGSLIFDDTKCWDKKLCFNPSTIKKNLTINRKQDSFISFKNEQPLKKEIKSFINCIIKNKQPMTNHEEALKVQKVISMIEKQIINKNL